MTGPSAPAVRATHEERYFRAIAAAEELLEAFGRSRLPEDRDRFLAAMSALVRLGDAWVAWRPPSKGMPEHLRATLIRCVDARDQQLPTVVAGNHAWQLIARAASRARGLPGVRDRDRAELARLEEHAWRRVIDLATITRAPDDHDQDVGTAH